MPSLIDKAITASDSWILEYTILRDILEISRREQLKKLLPQPKEPKCDQTPQT